MFDWLSNLDWTSIAYSDAGSAAIALYIAANVSCHINSDKFYMWIEFLKKRNCELELKFLI
jgi:hypothetical protein